MSTTMSVRSKFYPKKTIIADSASDYYEEKAELAGQAAEENRRNCVIDGVNPVTGVSLTLEEHASALEKIDASDDERVVYNTRRHQKHLQDLADDNELHDMINSQYPCKPCEHRQWAIDELSKRSMAAYFAVTSTKEHSY